MSEEFLNNSAQFYRNVSDFISLSHDASFSTPSFDPLAPGACLAHLMLLISPRKMHLSARLLGHFGFCLHLFLSNSKEAKEPDLLSISKLVSECLFHFIFSSPSLFSPSPLFPSQHHPWGMGGKWKE